VDRKDLKELHYITKLIHVPSILNYGILSHNQASKIEHESIANEEVQKIRKLKEIPGGMKLHDYANLYICARNPMLYVCRHTYKDLCVLQINVDVLDLPGVVVTDRNASAKFARYGHSPDGLNIVNKDLTFSEYWKDPTEIDLITTWRRKSAKCAEVLVPNSVHPQFIEGAYVADDETSKRLLKLAPDLTVTVDPHFFFL
jgi:hypothetical protein